MAKKEIKVDIECRNIAPLRLLKESVSASSLKYAVFAKNGSGKTFMSRMFRLTEKAENHSVDEEGMSTTDKLITKGETRAHFSFKISDESGVKEAIDINLLKGTLPHIPDTNYIYHTFNQDYIENNIQTLNFEKDSDVEGFILGKVNIDLSEEEKELALKNEEDIELTTQTAAEINNYIKTNIKPIRDIGRIKEFGNLDPKKIYDGINRDPFPASKSLESLMEDYNKIKSVPEKLPKLKALELIDISADFIESVINDCLEEFSLSDIAEEFKEKVKSKQSFIEYGISLASESRCPFCEQVFQEQALLLIDKYNEYLQDKEAITLKRFEEYQKKVLGIRKYLEQKVNDIEQRVLQYDSYKVKYIPSLTGKTLKQIDTSLIHRDIDELESLILEQKKNISNSVKVEKDFTTSLAKAVSLVNETITFNNSLISELNTKIDRISNESLNVRREICKAAYNHLVDKHRVAFQNIETLRADKQKLKENINHKKQLQKISKREKIVETVKRVLGYFFANKYSLDPITFRLTFNNDVLEKSEAKHVLSDGEKTIVAFAYYIGDVHLKVSSEDDYKKLFFIIDDPISSMDFDHVFTLCGVIRDLKEILDKLGRERMFIFTHNSEFMRVLTHHRIISKRLLLKKGKLHDFSINSTVPYINHLIDIYKIAKMGEAPSHTTANSIRHIIETLTKFDRVILEGESIKNFIAEKLPNDKKSCIMINDLSHGGFRSEQGMITDDDYLEMCKDILDLVGTQFPGQLSYCQKVLTSNTR